MSASVNEFRNTVYQTYSITRKQSQDNLSTVLCLQWLMNLPHDYLHHERLLLRDILLDQIPFIMKGTTTH